MGSNQDAEDGAPTEDEKPAAVGSTRGPYRTGVRRRQKILETATAMFAQYGYAGTSLRMIAEEVGVTTPGLIRHFGSKHALFTAVLAHSDATHSAGNLDGSHGIAGLRRFADAPAENIGNRGLVELLLTVAIEASAEDYPARPYIQSRYGELIVRLSGMLAEAAELGQVRPMSAREREMEARGLVALMDGIELQWLLDPEVDLVATYRHHFERMVTAWSD